MSELTPVMKQFFGVKEQHPDAIVFFRLGDFYEMFGEDAKIASRILQIALTSRDKSKEEQTPMCGIPYFSADSYISKLIKAGYKVAICEQVEDPKAAKGIVQREVVRVISPGTHQPDEPKQNTYLMCIFPSQNIIGVAVADLSTGEFSVYESDKPVEDEISRIDPREILCPASMKENLYYKEAFLGCFVTWHDDIYFDFPESYKTLLQHFRVASLDGFGCEGMQASISAAGALVSYLEKTQKILTFKKITVPGASRKMFLDAATKRNLELINNTRDGSVEGSLLWAMDETLTPMGGRFIRNAIANPLLDINAILERQQAVEAFVEDFDLFDELRYLLRKVQDIERLTSRIISRYAGPRDVVALKGSLEFLPEITNSLLKSSVEGICSIGTKMEEFTDLCDLIGSCIVDNPPATSKEGGFIRKGFSDKVDELRDISANGKDYIARLETEERQKTGISSLKIGFNKVFGYYIEITNSNLSLVPPDYTRKQTLANCERFITFDLKEYETKVLGAEDRLKDIESELFQELLDKMQRYADGLLNTSNLIALVDFYSTLAFIAKKYDYVRPVIYDGDTIDIRDGRHPVIERLINIRGSASMDDKFIPNNALMDSSNNRLLIITGPNMAGKSTYMRQVALIILMAQIGSFIPASQAKIGVVDRIFTRIGASDFISKGLSTFMVEMIETANILNNATSRSLILLDEVGRGTSTFDGISIAWAVAEYIAGTIRARTLFATHYNELTDLALNMEGIRNYNAVVKEWGDEVIFLRKIDKGPADKSYGIQVARLAGLPDDVIQKSRIMLEKLEKKEANALLPRISQMDLFTAGDPVTVELISMDLSSMKPQDAMRKLRELKKKAEKSS
jgi:DNA mismatch repair protein MutS